MQVGPSGLAANVRPSMSGGDGTGAAPVPSPEPFFTLEKNFMSFEYGPADQEALERRNARAASTLFAESQIEHHLTPVALQALEEKLRRAGANEAVEVSDEEMEAYRRATYLKPDMGKLRWDLLPQDALERVVAVLTVSADRLGRDWEKGCEWHRPFASAHRHMSAWWRGERVDEGTNQPHLACAIAQLLFLLAYEQRGHGVDDRSPNEAKP